MAYNILVKSKNGQKKYPRFFPLINKMRTLILNQNNVVNNSLNDTYTYQFPNGAVNFHNDQVAVASISIYFSWYNITSATTGSQYNNNTYQYIWTDGSGSSTYTVTMPDGYYEVTTLNAYLQSQMVDNGHYLVDAGGDFVYYLEIVANPTYYGVQLNCFALPTALPSGWTNPASISLPATASTPQFVILSTNNFQTVIGFAPGTYPTAVQATNYQVLSTTTPQLTPVSSLIMTCTLLNNSYALPNTLLYSFNVEGTRFGGLYTLNTPQFSFVDIVDGQYTNFTIQFFDQNLRRIAINDDNIVVMLVIGRKEQYVLK